MCGKRRGAKPVWKGKSCVVYVFAKMERGEEVGDEHVGVMKEKWTRVHGGRSFRRSID